MRVFIPSAGRASKPNTVRFVPEKYRPTLVVPMDEVDEYREHHSSEVIGCPVERIGPTRQWILDNSDDDHVFMVDDDHKFHRRRDDWETSKKLTLASEWTPQHSRHMFSILEAWLKEGFAMVGVCPRQGNNNITERYYRDVTRMNNMYGFDRRVLKELGLTFDTPYVMEDFDVTLGLLKAGRPNRLLVDYVWNQRASGEEGGCSSYRSFDLQNDSATRLYMRHKPFVTLRSKASGDGLWFHKPHLDVTIHWRKVWGKPVDNSVQLLPLQFESV